MDGLRIRGLEDTAIYRRLVETVDDEPCSAEPSEYSVRVITIALTLSLFDSYMEYFTHGGRSCVNIDQESRLTGSPIWADLIEV